MSKKYNAFISYSHQDTKWGEWLHKELEKFTIFKEHRDKVDGNKTLYPIFRDRAELPSSSSLNDIILEALQNSNAMIVICSPNAVKSQWVNEEIKLFKKLHGEDRVFALIVDGEPNAISSDKFDDQMEAFPKALRYEVDAKGELDEKRATEPVAADAREIGDEKERALIKIIAGLLGVGFEDLWQRDKKRKRRNFIILSVVIFIIFIIISGLAYFSYLKKNEAQEKLYINLMQQGVTSRDHLNDSLRAKHLFAEAIEESIIPEDEKTARIFFNNINNMKILDWYKSEVISEEDLKMVRGVTISKDGSEVLSWGEGKVMLWNRKNGQSMQVTEYKYDVSRAIFSRDGSEVLSWGFDTGFKGTVMLWNREHNNSVQVAEYKNDAIFSPDGSEVLSWGQDGRVMLWNREHNNSVHVAEYKNDAKGAIFSPDGSEVLSWSQDGKVMLWNRENNNSVLVAEYNDDAIFSPDGSSVLSWGKDGKVMLWNRKSGQSMQVAEYKSGIRSAAIFSQDGSEVLSWGYSGKDGRVMLWNRRSGQSMQVAEYKGRVFGAIFSPDGSAVLSWGSDGTIILSLLYERKEPSKDYYSTKLQVETGSYLNQYGEVKNLSIEEWTKLREEYNGLNEEKKYNTKPFLMHPSHFYWNKPTNSDFHLP